MDGSKEGINTSNPRYITVTGNATYIATFAVDQYQIDVLSGNDAMGTTSGSGTYDYGSAVQIRAIPYANYEFVNWSDGNTDNPRDITVLGNMTFVANFQPQTGINDNDLSAISVYSHDHQIVVCHAAITSRRAYVPQVRFRNCGRVCVMAAIPRETPRRCLRC